MTYSIEKVEAVRTLTYAAGNSGARNRTDYIRVRDALKTLGLSDEERREAEKFYCLNFRDGNGHLWPRFLTKAGNE
jgi:hypothetical protein